MSNIIHFEALSNNNYYFSQNPTKEFYVYLSLKGGKAPQKDKRPPLNIALVIDRSGSMSGDKLTYTKKAVDFVIDNVNGTDSMAIIQYDDKVEVVSTAALVSDKSKLHQKVAKIEAGGSTNLSGGMLEGYNQVNVGRGSTLIDKMLDFIKHTAKDGFVNRVLLLSDGLANVGVTELPQLQMIAQKKFREEQIGLSTFGVGADFNEEMMTNLAEYGGGNYHFIDKPDAIPQIFAKELSGLLSVIAQNTHVNVDFSSEYVNCTKVYGYPANISKGNVALNLNDIFSEEEKAVLLRFEVLKPFDTLPIKVALSYDDVVVKFEKVTESQTLTLTTTQDETLFKSGIQYKTLEQIAMFVANDMFESALKEVDKRNFNEAKQQLTQIKFYLDTHFQLFAPSEELKKQYKTICDYLDNLGNMETMRNEDVLMAQKMSKSMNYELRKKR